MTIRKLQQLEKSKLVLESLTEELRKRGYKKAQSERDYRRSLAKKELTLKTRGNNFPAGMVSDMARGDDEVSELRYMRDISIIEYEVCKDKLRNERSQIEALRSLIAYDRATYLNS
ncbi:hypothetical protein KPL40_03815 [Clostridium gasigenes]|uniref:hypothetical protein n=1 Tax=Clostridium gasigenes TaxID=94869 RepID=UPI001C0DE916|nr:hypothetical protein [Clostridium gasigenes]MBU3131568.1 hypothetical protein [Clostridium gasigenes]